MEAEQALEWAEAQKIAISVDLFDAAKRQLKFLAAVDRNRWLYEHSVMLRAIYRYNAYWLPLLAMHSKSKVSEGPLVVPLDCEWVWHCHRLNPIRHKSDCEEFYGRILENHNVVSSVQGISTAETEEIWNKLYPEEPYAFSVSKASPNDYPARVIGPEKFTKYDLVLAIERQIPFYYQVSRPHFENDIFLHEAVARYKGFLHLIKRNREKSINRFCVPTYDIDLIWHSHQLHSDSYCKDLVKILGKVLEHDDTDSDRSKGKKLDVGFSDTTKQFEETFGFRYWRAGAMYRGSAPSPLGTSSILSNVLMKKADSVNGFQKLIRLPKGKVVEVLLEFVEVRNLSEEHKGGVGVLFSKTQSDSIFNVKRKLNIYSESGEKQVALFQCQPTGYLFFELVFQPPSNLPMSKTAKTLGTCFISLEDLLEPVSQLDVDKWLELVPSSGTVSSKQIYLRVTASFTIPIPAPHSFKMVRSRPFLRSSCFLPFPGKLQFPRSLTRIIDDTGNEIISLQMRGIKKSKGTNNPILRKELIGITGLGEACTLAKFVGTEWSLLNSEWSLKFQPKGEKDAHLELTGHRMVKLISGRKLEFEPKHYEGRNEEDFMTAVEFSDESPYGRAIAVLDLKTEAFVVLEEWFALPGIISAFIISFTLRKEGYKGLTSIACKLKETNELNGAQKRNLTSCDDGVHQNVMGLSGSMVVPEKGGGCGNCGAGCDNKVKSGGYINKLESSGCGGCGGGCGNKLESSGCGGCGGGCGGGCESKMKSGGCGGCGGGCGGACGVNSGHRIEGQPSRSAVQVSAA